MSINHKKGVTAAAERMLNVVPRDVDGNALAPATETSAAAAAASLSVMDDWDESDRAKVNTIVGQAGVAAGAGAVSALTQRVTLASDDPLIASLATMQTPVTPAAATATKGMALGGEYRSTKPTFTNLQQGLAQLGARGAWNVNVLAADGTSGLDIAVYADSVSNSLGAALTFARNGHYHPTNNDWSRSRGDRNGQAMSLHAIGSAKWQYAGATGGITDAADLAVIAAGGAGVRNNMTGLQYQNISATPSEIVVKDGSTVIWRGYAAANMAAPAGLPPGTVLRGTANTAMNVQMVTTGTATIISAQGFQGAD